MNEIELENRKRRMKERVEPMKERSTRSNGSIRDFEPRYEMDFHLSSIIDSVSGNVDEGDLYTVSLALRDTAEREEKEGNLRSAQVLRLLAKVASMMLVPKDVERPFHPFVQLVDGSSSPIVDDFTEEDFRLLREMVETLKDHRLKARVADMLWYTKKPTKDFRMALLAIESYMEYPLDREALLRDGFEAWSRAIVLSKTIGKVGSDLLQTMEETLLEKLRTLENESYFEAYRISDLLFDIVEDKNTAVEIAGSRERVASELYARKNWRQARDAFEDAIRWYEKVSFAQEKSVELRDRIATTWLEEAESHLSGENGIGASVFFQNAIDELRKIPRVFRQRFATDDKIRRCREKLTQANRMATRQMQLIETGSYDITPMIEAARKHVHDKGWPMVLAYFSRVCGTTSKKELEKSAEGTMKKSIFRMLASSVRFSNDGRVVARTPSINPCDSNDPARLSAHEDEMQMHFSIWIGLCVQGSILPALEVLVEEHEVTEDKLYELCTKSIMVPVGRERFWSKGLYFGFTKDFMTSIHLLSPQLEHFVRMVLKDHGVSTTTIDENGIETENGLSALLGKKESVDIFEEDFLNEMKMLMSSARGPNLRNEIAHGLLEEEACNSSYAIYLWWRMLRMMVDGILIERKAL